MLDSKQLPRARNALELLNAAIFENKARTCDEVLDSAGYQHFAAVRTSCNASSRMDGNATQLVSHQLAFPRVEARANRKA